MTKPLVDDDGENLAVRAFLLQYGSEGLTVGNMRRHMLRSGFPLWPVWVEEQDTQHLSKAGAQTWLRHLFAQEPSRMDDLAQDIKTLALDVFDGPECAQTVRDAIEFFAAELSTRK